MVWEWLLGSGTGILGKAENLFGIAKWWGERRSEKSRVGAEIAKSHREVWALVRATPAAQGLFDRNRDLSLSPRTEEETHAVRLLLIHFAWALSEHRAGRYDLPEGLSEDVRNFFSYPVRRDAWLELKRYHNERVVAFVERALSRS